MDRELDMKYLSQYLDLIGPVYDVPQYECIVSYQNQIIYRYQSSLAKKRLYFVYSVTKPVTCAGALRLVEQDKLRLDAPVSKYLPEYGAMRVRSENGFKAAKRQIRIWELFTMCGGLNYDLTSPSIRKARARNPCACTREMVKAFAEEPLEFEPAMHYRYSLCHDVLAAVVESVSGMRFGEYQKRMIFDPLEMSETSYGIPEKKENQMAPQYGYTLKDGLGPKPLECEFILTPAYESGGAGLVTSADDYIKFAAAMANGGVSQNGYRLLKQETVDLMRTNQLPAECITENPKFDQGYGYGLGVRTMLDRERCGAKSPVGEFGWSGAGGAYALMDVKNQLALFYVQHVVCNSKVAREVHPMLRDLTYTCLKIDEKF